MVAEYRNVLELTPDGLDVGGTLFVGLLGQQINDETGPGSGPGGAGVFDNDDLDPAKRYKAVITDSTFAPDTLWLNENGSGYATADGTATLLIYEDNLLIGSTALVVGEASVKAPYFFYMMIGARSV